MTCFWRGIISSLSKDDLNLLGFKTNPTPKQLCYILKKKIKNPTNLYGMILNCLLMKLKKILFMSQTMT